MPDTVVGLFRTRDEQLAAVRELQRAGFARDLITTATPERGRTGHYGAKVLAGIAVGILIGIIAGALATGMVPGVKPLVGGNLLVTFLFAAAAGAATGALAGMLVSMAGSGDRALFYEQEVESGRFLISVTGPRLDEALGVMSGAGALEAVPVEAPLKAERPRPESG